MAVYADPDAPDRLNQGDLLADVAFVGQDARDRTQRNQALGLITSHSCDCDKFFALREKGLPEEIEMTWPIMVAPVHSPDDLLGGQPGDARAGRMPRYFPLPAEGDHPDLVVDLWREEAVPAVTLLELDRQACLSRETLLAAYVHLWVLRTRLPPKDVFKEGALDAP